MAWCSEHCIVFIFEKYFMMVGWKKDTKNTYKKFMNGR